MRGEANVKVIKELAGVWTSGWRLPCGRWLAREGHGVERFALDDKERDSLHAERRYAKGSGFFFIRRCEPWAPPLLTP